ncbi:hypothetical protein C0J52_25712, partial [Blattella germanica]
ILNTWERKILRKTYGAVQERNVWRIRTNKKLKELFKNTDLIRDIKRTRIDWVGHVLGMDQQRDSRNILEGRPEGRRKVGRQKLRWLDKVKEVLKLQVKIWRLKVKNREEWAVVVKEARVLKGP